MIRTPSLPLRGLLLGVVAGALAATGSAAAAPDASVTVQLRPGASAVALPAGAEPLIDPRDAAVLADRAALRGRTVPDLGRWYAVPVDSPAEGRALARALDAPAGQQAALQLPPPPPPRAACRRSLEDGPWPSIPSSGPVPDLSGVEDHRSDLAVPSDADGAGVRVGDVEFSWVSNHVELIDRDLPAPPGSTYENHGTSVLAIIGGAADGQGTTGIAPRAEMRPVSPGSNVAGAITSLAADLRPGDVLLIEQQAWVMDAATGTRRRPLQVGPVEMRPDARQAIAAATAAGIVVVEPAGNGVLDGDQGVSLDDLGIPLEGEPGFSGAIIVGAGQSSLALGGGTELARESFSNHGRRVDVQGHGESVVTAGHAGGDEVIGGPDARRSYTACFNGTSSAAATVTGAVAALQSLARARLGAPLDPQVLRRRLIETGLPQQDPENGRIGPRPQVESALPPPPEPVTSAPAPPAPVPAAPVATIPVVLPPASAPVTTTPPAPAPAPAPRLGVAARGLRASFASRPGRLTIRLRGLAPRATVRIGARVLRVRGGRVLVPARRGARLVVRVTASSRGGAVYRAAAFRITVTRAGGVRVTALTSPRSPARP